MSDIEEIAVAAEASAEPPRPGRSIAIGAALLASAVQLTAVVAWHVTEGYCDATPSGRIWSHGPLADGLALAGTVVAPLVALVALPWLVRRRPGRLWLAIAARVAVALSLPFAYYLFATDFGESFLAC